MIKDIQRNILWKHEFYSKTLTRMLRKLKIDWKNIKYVEIQINSNKSVDNSILYDPHFCNISFINYLKTKWRSFFYDTLCISGDLCTLRCDASRTMKRRVPASRVHSARLYASAKLQDSDKSTAKKRRFLAKDKYLHRHLWK